MYTFARPVRFEEIDAAGIVFFGRFFQMCHDAMEGFFSPLDGGYRHLIAERKIGLPAVHVECDYRAPLRYGDIANIEVTVKKIGTTSVTFGFKFIRAKDNVVAAEITQTNVVSDLVKLAKIAIPADVRRVLESHLVPPSA